MSEIAQSQFQTLTLEQLQERINQHDKERERLDVAPTRKQLISPFTVFCLIINRTIASGIFTQPINVLNLTGSAGISLVLWFAGGVIVTCVVATWIEFALTVPLHYIFRNGVMQRVSAPRNGGDKNYLEYVFKRPQRLMTCIFGIGFTIFGNLAGNALQFGIYMQRVIMDKPECKDNESGLCDVEKGPVIAWAVAVLTVCALINVATRSYTLGLNNIFAVTKITFVAAITVLGIAYGTVHGNQCKANISWEYKGDGATGGVADISRALFFAMYPYTGFEQPFYVVSEVRKPHKTFAKATMIAMVAVLVLYPLTNVSYLCMVPFDGKLDRSQNMALLYFENMSNTSGDGVIRGVSALLAFFIFGNLMAQTFTATRVKQEIAKEGIFPWSLALSSSNDTLFSRLSSSSSSSKIRPSQLEPAANLDDHREQTPIPATFLHWFFEIVLVIVASLSTNEVSDAYRLLTYLYTYIIVGIFGFLTAAGLLYLKLEPYFRGKRSRDWPSKTRWTPPLDPLPVFIATVTLLFLLFAGFAPPNHRDNSALAWWISPTIGLASAGLGVVWWLGLRFVQWAGRWELDTKRLPVVEIDEDGQAIQRAELVEHRKIPVEGRIRSRTRHSSVAV